MEIRLSNPKPIWADKVDLTCSDKQKKISGAAIPAELQKNHGRTRNSAPPRELTEE